MSILRHDLFFDIGKQEEQLFSKGESVQKTVKLMIAVFLALGSMITLSPREGRSREIPVTPEDGQQGIERHFEAAWAYLANAVTNYEKRTAE